MSDELEAPLNQPLPKTLSRRQLTLGLVFLTAIPFLCVVLLYLTMPENPDPVLDVELQVGPRPWQADNTDNQPRLLPSLIVRNPTGELWNNVNFAINDQFYYYHPNSLQPQEELVIPLKFFHTKGNQFYPPESQPLKTITAYAQIASGARAIKEFSGDEIQRPH